MEQKCGRSLLAGSFQLRSLALIGSASLSEGEVWRTGAIFFCYYLQYCIQNTSILLVSKSPGAVHRRFG